MIVVLCFSRLLCSDLVNSEVLFFHAAFSNRCNHVSVAVCFDDVDSWKFTHTQQLLKFALVRHTSNFLFDWILTTRH